MCGVLEIAVRLGACKLLCNLLTLPSVTAPVISIASCCNCLLLFTDVSVTAFLALLWLADQWMPRFPVSGDIIALRFLLFLGHTYGAILVLTTPLITVETVCRLLWPLPWLEGQEERETRKQGGHGTIQEKDWTKGCNHNRRKKGKGHVDGDRESVVHFPGLLCCLLVWILSALHGWQQWGLEQDLVEDCLWDGGSLSVCLPNLITATLRPLCNPSLILPILALCLVLTLSLRALRGSLTDSQTGQAGSLTDHERGLIVYNTHGVRWGDTLYSVHVVKAHTAATHLFTGCLSDEVELKHAAAGKPDIATHVGYFTEPRIGLPDPQREKQRVGTATQLQMAHTSTLQGHNSTDTSPGGKVSLQDRVLKGLLSSVAICLFPPVIVVHTSLFWSVEMLSDWGLKHLLNTPQREGTTSIEHTPLTRGVTSEHTPGRETSPLDKKARTYCSHHNKREEDI
ncbi:uncharacterized protein [Lepisosteus oculatus]|uniref:uncharacterized protein n=1 Tax=Lepisosteus oculatus TaxID=7918 RepID=UPI00371E3FD2